MVTVPGLNSATRLAPRCSWELPWVPEQLWMVQGNSMQVRIPLWGTPGGHP